MLLTKENVPVGTRFLMSVTENQYDPFSVSTIHEFICEEWSPEGRCKVSFIDALSSKVSWLDSGYQILEILPPLQVSFHSIYTPAEADLKCCGGDCHACEPTTGYTEQ